MIDNSFKILLYDNKTKLQFKDTDIIIKDSFLEYELTPIEFYQPTPIPPPKPSVV